MRSESFRKGVKDGIPIGLGYFAVSFTFGMMAVADGLSIWQAVLISLTNVTSAGQFASSDKNSQQSSPLPLHSLQTPYKIEFLHCRVNP